LAKTEPAPESLLNRMGLDRPLRVPQMEGPARLLPGDRMPNFRLPGPDDVSREFYALMKGRPALLVLAANTGRQDQWDEIKALAAALPDFEAAGLDLFIVSNDGVESLALVSKTIPAPAVWFADIQGMVNIGIRGAAKFEMAGLLSFLIDADQRVIALRGPEPGHAAWALATLWEQPQPEPLVLSAAAPVLMMPTVLDGRLCGRLLEQLETAGAGAHGAAVEEGEFAAEVAQVMLRRIGPEVEKVFDFEDIVLEEVKVRRDAAGPDATVERRHDIVDIVGAERRFTLLLDLDAAGYEGGGFAFPEYGPHVYRPGTGGALIYSGALLAEIRPPVSGRRSLLTAVLRQKPSATKGKPGAKRPG
jgi:peroxiredoxin